MPVYKWQINLRDLQMEYNRRRMESDFLKGMKVWNRYYKNCEIDQQKYYEGFNVGREKTMFKEELQDLEIQYKYTLCELQKKVEDCLPSLLYYMEEFVTLHKQNEAVREKLDSLLEKLGRGSQEEDNGGEDE